MEACDKFKVSDADQITWGRLVKAWTKGEVPRPADLGELQAQCRERGIAFHLPDYVTDLAFVQNDKHVLTIRLPPRDLHVIGERNVVEQHNGYPLPSWYERFFRSPVQNTDLTGEERFDLHAARVGEYSINICL